MHSNGNTVTISCTSPAVRRKLLVNRSNPRMHLRARVNAIPWPDSAARPDLNMRTQLRVQALRREELHLAWVEKHRINIERTPEEEKHYLKILVRSAILRQKTEGSTYLSRMILSSKTPQPHPPATPSAHKSRFREAAGAPAPPTPAKIVTKSQAYDLDFVAKCLSKDIDLLYGRHGYNLTLQALEKLMPWQL